MALFDQLDQLASNAIGTVLNERVIWRPMVVVGGPYTGEGREPDPEREARELDAVVTWRLTTAQIGTGGDTPSGLVVADCVVDFDKRVFQDLEGNWAYPRKGDLIELLEETPGQNLVMVQGMSDDGAARLHFMCTPEYA